MISWLEKNNKLSWTITAIIAITIFYLSSLNLGSRSTNTISMLYHISAFFFLSLFLLISIVRKEKKNLILLAIMIAIFYGISDEIHQFFVPGRNTSLLDVFLDSLGTLYAFMVYFISLEYRGKRSIPRKLNQNPSNYHGSNY